MEGTRAVRQTITRSNELPTEQNTSQVINQANEVKQDEPNQNVWAAFAAQSDIEEATSKANEELLAFVDKQIQRMNNKVQFNKGDISLYELDMALATYEPTLFALIALYEQAKAEAEISKAKYDEWYYDKYMEIRNTYNTKDVKNAQWLSAKEIEATLFKIYRKDAAQLKADVIKTEGQRSTMERLLKSWESYQFVLTTMSRNVTAQMGGSNISVDLKRPDDNVQGW